MWEMGGYGYYIWPCYALVLGGMLLFVIHTLRQAKQLKKQIKLIK